MTHLPAEGDPGWCGAGGVAVVHDLRRERANVSLGITDRMGGLREKAVKLYRENLNTI